MARTNPQSVRNAQLTNFWVVRMWTTPSKWFVLSQGRHQMHIDGFSGSGHGRRPAGTGLANREKYLAADAAASDQRISMKSARRYVYVLEYVRSGKIHPNAFLTLSPWMAPLSRLNEEIIDSSTVVRCHSEKGSLNLISEPNCLIVCKPPHMTRKPIIMQVTPINRLVGPILALLVSLNP